ncbi:MAG: methyltransferase domain-containing protein [Magnetococcales bacterium]|nr:methyltransferase domain-containing protein [Magnetococcales bacterium]
MELDIKEAPWQFLDSEENNHIDYLKDNYVPMALIDMLKTTPKLAMDIGCFVGTTGAYIKQKWPECRVVGVEPTAKAAAQARTKVDALFEGPFENMPLDSVGVKPGNVDLVVFADVLEHMHNPWAALIQVRKLLSPTGAVLVSLPNVRNLKILGELACGNFRYKPAGILDITHIRFFTYSDALIMFEQTGFTVEERKINCDSSLVETLKSIPKDRSINMNMGKFSLHDVNYSEAEELCALQFFFLLRATDMLLGKTDKTG